VLLCNKTLLEGQVCNNNNILIYFLFSFHLKCFIFFRYKRIFGVGTHGITTYNPNSLEVTNRYSYNQIINIQVDPQNAGGFMLSVKDKNKVDRFKFSTDFRSNLLTDALMFRYQFAERGQEEIYVCLN
jgi:DnaJ family protein C protein 13